MANCDGIGGGMITTASDLVALVHTLTTNGLHPANPSGTFLWGRRKSICRLLLPRIRCDPLPKGNEMVHTTRSSHPRAHLVFLVGVVLAVALAITPQARSTVAQSKSASSRSKGAPAVSLKMTKTASKPASLHRDLLMHLEEGQKGLQRQLESLTGTTQRRTDDLDRRIDTLTGQLSRLASAQQQSTATQQTFTAAIRSMRLLLMIIVGLLLILCGALFFFVYQVKQIGGFVLKDRNQIGATTGEAPDETFEPEWKVSS